LVNNTFQTAEVKYTIYSSSNGCIGQPVSTNVTVKPIPNVLASPITETICGDSVTQINLSGNITGTNYSWNAGLQTGLLTGFSNCSQCGNIIQQLLHNQGNVPASVLYTVTPTANGCNGQPISVPIVVNPVPTIGTLATPSNLQMCSNSGITIQLSNPNNVNNTIFQWIGSTISGMATGAVNGTGSSIVQTLQNPGNTPSTVKYTIRPVSGSCKGLPTDVIFTVNPIPNVLATPGSQNLCTGMSTSINLSNPNNIAGTSYTWSTSLQSGSASGYSGGQGNSIVQYLTNTTNTSASILYTITPSTVYCTGTPISLTVNTNPRPDVAISPITQEVCSSHPFTLALSNPNNIVGTVQYSWNVTTLSGSASGYSNGPLSSVNTISQTLYNAGAGPANLIYSVVPTFNGCAGTPVSASIFVNPLPVPILTSNAPICALQSLHLGATTNGGGGSLCAYSWTGPVGYTSVNQNPVIEPVSVGANGTYKVVITNVFNCRDSGTMNIPIYPLPVANAGLNQFINYGTSTTLSGAATGGTTPYSCSWKPIALINGSNTAWNPNTLNLAPAGTFPFMLTVKDYNNCESLPDTVLINVTGSALSASIAATPDSICLGNTSQLNLIVGGGNLAYTYNWASNPPGFSSVSGNPVVSPMVTTIYNVTISDGFNQITRSVKIIVILPVQVNAGNDTTICTGTNLLVISSAASNFNSILWESTGDGIFTNPDILYPAYIPGVNDFISGMFTLKLTAYGNEPCGDLTDSCTVHISPLTASNAGIDGIICEGETFTITTASTVNATFIEWISSGDGSFDNGNILSPTYTPGIQDILAGQVILSLHAVNAEIYCGDTTNSMLLKIKPLPQTNAGPDIGICIGNSIHLQGSGGQTYHWFPATGLSDTLISDPIANPASSTLYYLNVSLNGCSKTDSVFVTVYPLPVAAAWPDTAICLGKDVSLNAGGGLYYQWSNGALAAVINVAPIIDTIYTVTVTDIHQCSSLDTVSVVVHELPQFEVLPEPAAICSDSSILLHATGPYTFNWSPSGSLSSNSGNMVLASPAGTTAYHIEALSNFGCITKKNKILDVYPTPTTRFSDSSYVCPGEPITLDAGNHEYATIHWSNGSGNQTITIEEPGIFWVNIENPGCHISDTIFVNSCSLIWVPNAFTPNHDGNNDVFLAKASTSLIQYRLQVFNRWGILLFESENISIGWDGKNLKGDDCPSDVYVYLLTWEGYGWDAKDRKGQKKGTVTLLR
jgi:gliding motility-associated-like protein